MDTRNVLIKLLDQYLEGDLAASDFCQQFEHAYNFEANLSSFSNRERRAFSVLFDVVAWYVQDPEERSLIPHYKSDKEVLDAARSAAVELKRPGAETT